MDLGSFLLSIYGLFILNYGLAFNEFIADLDLTCRSAFLALKVVQPIT